MNEQQLSKGNKVGRGIYFILLCLFFLSIIIQFFLAGLAVFVHPLNWAKHITFVHLFGFNIPLFLLLFAYIGKLPRWAYWNTFGLLIGIFGMYFTANITAEMSWGGALHPIIAIGLFLISYHGLTKTIKFLFNKEIR